MNNMEKTLKILNQINKSLITIGLLLGIFYLVHKIVFDNNMLDLKREELFKLYYIERVLEKNYNNFQKYNSEIEGDYLQIQVERIYKNKSLTELLLNK